MYKAEGKLTIKLQEPPADLSLIFDSVNAVTDVFIYILCAWWDKPTKGADMLSSCNMSPSCGVIVSVLV